MNNLDFLGNTIPSRIGEYLTPERHGLLYTGLIKGLQIMQSEGFRNLPVAERKTRAIQIAASDYPVQSRVLNAYADVDQYVTQTLLPAMIDGAVASLNNALWFDTEKAIDIGGKHTSGDVPAFTRIPVPAPVRPDLAEE